MTGSVTSSGTAPLLSLAARPDNSDVWKLNPLVDWSRDQVWAYLKQHDLPHNVLHDRGYRSIGCWPCTQPTSGGDEPLDLAAVRQPQDVDAQAGEPVGGRLARRRLFNQRRVTGLDAIVTANRERPFSANLNRASESVFAGRALVRMCFHCVSPFVSVSFNGAEYKS